MKGGYDVLHLTIFMIVNPSVKYNSSILKKDLDALIFKYPFLKLYTIGYSVLDNPIYSVRLGFGSKQVCYLASTHANEYITTTLLMKFLENMCIAYYQNSSISGYNVKNLLNSTTIYLIPLVNPDGVDLLNGNISSTSNAYIYARYIASKYPDIPFPNGWKANIKGVDLKNFQPFCKALHCLIYTALLVFPFSFIISSILINSSKFSVIEFNFEKLKYI